MKNNARSYNPQITLSRPRGPAKRKPPRAWSSPSSGGGEDNTDGASSSVEGRGKGISEGGSPLEKRILVCMSPCICDQE